MKKLHATVAVIGLIGASAAAYWFQHRTAPADGEAAVARAPAPGASRAGPAGPGGGGGDRGPVAVEVGKVQTMPLADEAQAVGTIRSRQGVVVRPEVSGRIAAMGFSDGQRVRKGQLLVQLDDALLRAQVQQAQAQVNIARANNARNRELLAQNFVSQAAVDQTASNLEVAQAQLALAQAQLARMRIVAPFDGTVGIASVNVGDYVKDGADLVNLEDLRTVYVDFRLPERYLSRLKVGQASQVALDALPGRKFAARVVALEPQVDVSGRSVLVRAALDNAEQLLRPGMFARVETVLSTRAEALVVPEEALVPQGGKQYVIKVVDGAAPAEGRAAKVSQRAEVQTGLRRDGKVEIVQGVALGDVVVTAGHQRVQRDGAPLRIVQIGADAARQGPASAPARDASASAGSSSAGPRVAANSVTAQAVGPGR